MTVRDSFRFIIYDLIEFEPRLRFVRNYFKSLFEVGFIIGFPWRMEENEFSLNIEESSLLGIHFPSRNKIGVLLISIVTWSLVVLTQGRPPILGLKREEDF